MSTQESPLDDKEFASAVELLHQLLPDDELDRFQPTGPATVYTTMVTLWMLILGVWLAGRASLLAGVCQSGARLRSLRRSERRWIPSRRAASEMFPPQSARTRWMCSHSARASEGTS